MSKTKTSTLDPLSSEAMYDKHAAAVAEQHALLKKKKRKHHKKKEQEGEVYLLKGEYKLTYEFADGDSTLFQPGVLDAVRHV